MLDVLVNSSPSDKGILTKRLIKVSNRADKPVKSIIKSVSWRILGTLDTMIISFFITGKITVAVSIGSIEVITKTILYYFHERFWAHIHRIKLNFLNKSNGKSFAVKRVEEPDLR